MNRSKRVSAALVVAVVLAVGLSQVAVSAHAVRAHGSGTFYPNQPFFLLAEEPRETVRPVYWTELAGMANASGNFSVNVATQGSQAGFDLVAGDQLYVECRTKKGDLLWSLDEV